ncbi:hypothetical protein [Granulicoccus sp. GXG6511]|uniref:hypothetical protein n=1 Tax=Granulicoccus sp. GXG6511 TaxID=3381351 RepID=UPI003D7CAB76
MNLVLPAALSLTALALVVAIVLWLRGRRGRALQAFGFAALPVGLYLTGLLGMVFDAAAALGRWAGQLVFNPAVWAGLGLLGLAVVLWVVGGFVARRTRGRRPVEKAADRKSVEKRTSGRTAPAARSGGATADNEFDEIEELLRKRGIE